MKCTSVYFHHLGGRILYHWASSWLYKRPAFVAIMKAHSLFVQKFTASCCKCVCVLTQTGVFPSLQRTQHYINIHFLRTINPVCAWYLLFLSVTTFCACKGELRLFKLMFTQHERNTQRNRSIETELKLDSLKLHAGVVLHYCKMTQVTIHNL